MEAGEAPPIARRRPAARLPPPLQLSEARQWDACACDACGLEAACWMDAAQVVRGAVHPRHVHSKLRAACKALAASDCKALPRRHAAPKPPCTWQDWR